MPDGVGCAICGRAAISRRIDLTDSDVNTRDVFDYDVRGVLRGVLLCPACVAERPIGQLLNLRGGVELVRGCMVQCADNPPRHLRWTLPGGTWMWSKTVCPTCKGRATVQFIADVVERPPSAFREGIRQAFGLLAWWRDDDGWDEEEDQEEPVTAAIESGGEVKNGGEAENVTVNN